jgi:transposase
MLGPVKPRRLDRPIAVSLEDLVPADNFYRHLEAELDLGFVRDWARELYAERGRPSIDPVVFFKLQLVMFFEGIRSERKLVETAGLNLAHRWYLGYALDEALPDHSSLTRIRQRLGVETFERFFERIVDLCQEAGLVWGRELYFDATKVRADAAVASLVPRFAHEAKAHVGDLFVEDPPNAATTEAATDAVPADGLLRLPSREGTSGTETGQAIDRPWDLLAARRLDPNRPASGTYQRTSDWRVSTTDPDATPMRVEGGTRLGYHDHYVVDGGEARIILAVLVTPADVMENVPMRDLLWRVRFRRKLWPRQVTGDTTYGTVENIVATEEQGIRAYVPLPDFDRRTPYFGKGDFTYDAETDAYRCPGGAKLQPLKHDGDPPARIYQAPAVAYARAMRKRKVWVEPLFAEAKDWHGLRRFRLRGLDNVNVEGLLKAAGQNLKRLLSRAGWGRRPWPNGAAGLGLPNPAPAPRAAP